MARHDEVEVRSRNGKLARSVFATLLCLLPVAAAPSFGRLAAQVSHTGPQATHAAPQANRPRFENNQQPHLGAWLQRHEGLSPEEQEKALQNEPGFSHLPPEMQQRLLTRLHQLNHMPPNQRQRILDPFDAAQIDTALLRF